MKIKDHFHTILISIFHFILFYYDKYYLYILTKFHKNIVYPSHYFLIILMIKYLIELVLSVLKNYHKFYQFFLLN